MQAGRLLCCGATLHCSEQGQPMQSGFSSFSTSWSKKSTYTTSLGSREGKMRAKRADGDHQSSYNTDATEQGLHLQHREAGRCQLDLTGSCSTLCSWMAAYGRAARAVAHLPGRCGAHGCHTAVPVPAAVSHPGKIAASDLLEPAPTAGGTSGMRPAPKPIQGWVFNSTR